MSGDFLLGVAAGLFLAPLIAVLTLKIVDMFSDGR